MRLLGSTIVLGLLGTFVACGKGTNQSSSQIKSESEIEVLKLKSVTAAECGIWGEEYQKRPHMVDITEMSCPGSVKAHLETNRCSDFASCMPLRVGFKLRCEVVKGVYTVTGNETQNEIHTCNWPDQPATCQRQDGMEDDASKPKVRIVGANGQTVKTCEIYKDAQELKTYLTGRQELLKSSLQSAVEIEGLYYSTQGSKTELACLISSLDQTALKGTIEKLKSKYKTIFGLEYAAPEGCKSDSLSTLAKVTPSEDDQSSLAKATRKFKQLNDKLLVESKNLGLLYENTKDKAFADDDKKALGELQLLLKQHGRP